MTASIRLAFCFASLIALEASAKGKTKPAQPAAPVVHRPVVEWPRLGADELGCLLEREYGARDSKFNCKLKHYKNKGDPCRNTKAYTEGPSFPNDKAAQVSPEVESVVLNFEHGQLQEAVFRFKRLMSEETARQALGLPQPAQKLPENVLAISVQECGLASSCLSLTGFDHQGAGDVDCSAKR
jgi:hypothetical protein